MVGQLIISENGKIQFLRITAMIGAGVTSEAHGNPARRHPARK